MNGTFSDLPAIIYECLESHPNPLCGPSRGWDLLGFYYTTLLRSIDWMKEGYFSVYCWDRYVDRTPFSWEPDV